MSHKKLLQIIGFQPKENASDIFIKKYNDDYCIEIDFDKNIFFFGGKIKIYEKDYQNITKPEDWVVFECVNRLLEKGYKPENISLEKVYPAGRGFSGRLDICVTNEDGSEYLLIECKTYGKEFDKEFSRIKKDGGQLFTYFKFSNKADLIMLYASELQGNKIEPKYEIVKIKEEYRIGDVKDFYNCWDKKTYQNIVWENLPYNSEIKKSFTKLDLHPLSKDQSDTIFHGFASILRKHSVSDKPNAFNKIFNLFLAKLYDEDKGDDMELEFHWREKDDPVDFQVRLVNLHKKGLEAFLAKEIAGIEDSDFEGAKNAEELRERKKKILMFNNIFAIKEVDDAETFDNNQRVLKEVVQLLEKYQIRYPRKQQHLSDFFELLLTTGLKQEVGQYFTPPPVTKFIVRSLPIKKMMLQEINNEMPKLPAIIDYAAGSGHFITEALEEYQDIINNIDIDKELSFPKAKSVVQSWVADPYNWASRYVYGIEKDYRLVKVAKVGCYFYGDGVAQIIHGDGLDSFATSKTYKGLLKENINIKDSSKAKFSVVISNPPYAVNDCKDDLEYIGAQNEFTLYNSLTDKSDQVECLFVERTKQLLKDDGIAAIILPNTILNIGGIYKKTREIILQYFDIVAIAEFGGNTFLATSVNTVTLFLKRRPNKLSIEWKKSVNHFIETQEDITIKGIEKPTTKYVNYVWENIDFKDYTTLIEKKPNQAIQNHEIYIEYRKKIKTKSEKEFWEKLIDIEKEKLYYFLIAYNQTVTLVKTGEKDAEKRFLGYEISKARNNEGLKSVIRGQNIDESTQLYNSEIFDDPTKASTYIYDAFEKNYDRVIDPTMQNNVYRHNLIDMINFDRTEFDINISLSIKKKVKVESKWELKNIGDFLFEQPKSKIQVKQAKDIENGEYLFFTSGENILKYDSYLVDNQNIYLSTGGNAIVKFYDGKASYSTDTYVVKSNNESKIKTKYIFIYLESIIDIINEFYFKGLGLKHLQKPEFRNIKIPLPPLEIQQQIVSEIEILETKDKIAKEEIVKLNNQITDKINQFNKFPKERISNLFAINEKTLNPIEKWKDEEFTYVDIDAVGKGDGKINFDQKILGKDAPSRARRIAENNSVIISTVRPYLKGFVYIETERVKTLFSTGFAILKSLNEQNFITKLGYYYFMFSSDLMIQMEEKMPKASYPSINKEDLDNFKIPFPPLSEQQKIVSEIEKIEAKIAVLEDEIAQIPKDKETILKHYLQY